MRWSVYFSGLRWLLPPSRAGYKYGALARWFCKAAAAFSLKLVEVLKFAFLLPRVVSDGFGTVRMCVAGGVDANVFTCFSVGGTGLNGVTVRLFFTAGGIGDPRVVLIFRFSPGGSGWSFCPAALSLLRGFGAAWVLCAGGLDVFGVVERSLVSAFLLPVSSLLCRFSGPGVCRRPGLDLINTGLITLAYLRFLFVLVCWCLPPSRAG